MPELRATPPAGDPRRLALRRSLGAHWKLQVVAEHVLGAESRIDLVGVGADGQTLLVLVAEPGRDLELVARGLAQCAWVEARLPDWLQLAPELGARPEAGVAALLLCPHFGPEALAAGASAGGRLHLATCHFASEGAELRAWIAPVERAPRGRSAPEPGDEPIAAFRTGLSDADLGISTEESAALANGTPRGTTPARSSPTEIL